MSSETVSIVIPSNRPERIGNFLSAWESEFSGYDVIVVEDAARKSFGLPSWVRHYSWAEIDKILLDDAWIIPRRSDCIRSFGFLMAKGDFILTLDDDCSPKTPGFIAEHIAILTNQLEASGWTMTIDGIRPRGMPSGSQNRTEPCVLNHGLWCGVPDIDAQTQIKVGSHPPFLVLDQVIPRGQFFAMCGMNLSFCRIMLPAMYFLLMGEDWTYDRFGDIWCGLFAKAIADHLGFAVHSGAPYVIHDRASDAQTNRRKESPGYLVNEWLWRTVDRIRFGNAQSVADCYLQIAAALPTDPYWKSLRQAMTRWVQLTRVAPFFAGL